MRYLKYVMLLVLAALLSACGGGGNPGSTSSSGGTSGSGSTGGSTGSPTMTLSLVNAAGTTLSVNSISKSANYYAKALVTDASGSALANQLVTFSTTYTIATLSGSAADATALTDSSGVAKVLISPLSLTTTGATTLTAAVTVSGTSLSSSLNFGTTASNVTLGGMTTSSSSIAALETTAVTVIGSVDGSASSGVVVNFTASCGTFSPSSATTISGGTAKSTYQSLSSCASTTVTLTASASGATDVTKTVTVAAAKATNILFTSATPATIFLSTAASGAKSSIVKFQVVDSSGTGLSGKAVSFSLSSQAIAAGVTFSSTTTQGVTTDSSGFASVTVASGTVPTPVVVTATLDSDTAVSAESLQLVVNSGKPAQGQASISAAKHSLEALNIDGLTSSVVFRVADQAGNDVPDNTVVSFVASAGKITSSCLLTSSTCTVTYTAQGSAPSSGRAVILAYLDGEESFDDANGDRIWQSTETFYDTGTAYLDLSGDGVYQSGETLVTGGSTGSSACSADTDVISRVYPSVENTCDGTWSSNIRVRKQEIITWSTSAAVIELSTARTSSGFTVWIHDASGANNAMPSGTTVAAAITSANPTCTVKSVTESSVGAGHISGTFHQIALDKAADCTTVTVTVTVTTPSGAITRTPF